MASPVVPQGNAVGTYTTDYLSNLDLLKFQYSPEEYLRYLEDGGLLSYMESFVDTVSVAGENHTHYESMPLNQYASVKLHVADPGAGNPITFTIGAADYLENGTKSDVQVDSDVFFMKNKVLAKVTAVNKSVAFAHTVTCAPYDETENIGELFINDVVLTEFSNSYLPGTDQPQGRLPTVASFIVYMQIQKAALKTDGSAFGDAVWTEFNGKPYLYSKAMMNTDLQFRGIMERALLHGKINTNDAQLGTLQTFDGLIPSIQKNGTVYPYTQGSFTYDKWIDLMNTIDTGFTPTTEFMLKCGKQLHQEINRWVQDFMKNGAVSYGAFSGDQKKAISFQFDSLTESGYTIHIGNYRPWTNGFYMGAPTSTFPGDGILIPTGMTTDGKGKKVPFMRKLIKDGQGWDRSMVTWANGVGPQVKTGTVDQFSMNYLSEWAPEFYGLNQYAYIERINS